MIFNNSRRAEGRQKVRSILVRADLIFPNQISKTLPPHYREVKFSEVYQENFHPNFFHRIPLDSSAPFPTFWYCNLQRYVRKHCN